MLKNCCCRPWVPLLVIVLSACLKAHAQAGASDGCPGRFPNPITDICWLCLFPIDIGGLAMTAGQQDNGDPPPPLLCSCPAPPPVFVRYGIGLGFWEPARIAEVVRQPMCSPTLNGQVLGNVQAPRGTHSESDGESGQAFYHVHWLQYPVMNWLGMAITQGACLVNDTFDMAYMSELDPLWDDDELTFLLNPEAALFTSAVSQSACIADAAQAARSDFGIDALHWCSGSQGSLYPLSGNHANHVGGIDSSLALTHTMIFKLHRQLLAQDTSTHAALCGNVPQPIMRKNQYKAHLMYPVPWNHKAYGFGAPSAGWAAGREFPYTGEDFTYLVWRKRMCCAF